MSTSVPLMTRTALSQNPGNLALVLAVVAATALACTMMATTAPIASIKAYGSNTGGG